MQATNRALLVDTLPTAEQAGGNAWAARMLGIGSVAGFFVWVPTRVQPFDVSLNFFSLVGTLI